jgi:predicted nucleic acid-binding protein
MPDKRFIDTNVLLYAFSSDDPRGARAEALLGEGGVVGVQVLNEFASVARRKLGWNWVDIQAALDVIQELLGPARALTVAIHTQAVEWARVRKLDFYDALILSAAADAGCVEVLTEDMHNGSKVGGVTVRNPFL